MNIKLSTKKFLKAYPKDTASRAIIAAAIGMSFSACEIDGGSTPLAGDPAYTPSSEEQSSSTVDLSSSSTTLPQSSDELSSSSYIDIVESGIIAYIESSSSIEAVSSSSVLDANSSSSEIQITKDSITIIPNIPPLAGSIWFEDQSSSSQN